MGLGGFSGEHWSTSSSSIGSGIPLGTRTGLNGFIIGDGGRDGGHSTLVSFLYNTTVMTASPIKAYSSMFLPKSLHEVILEYKFAMEQHDRHKQVMRSLEVFFVYVRYRRFIKFQWPRDAMRVQMYKRFLDFFQWHIA